MSVASLFRLDLAHLGYPVVGVTVIRCLPVGGGVSRFKPGRSGRERGLVKTMQEAQIGMQGFGRDA